MDCLQCHPFGIVERGSHVILWHLARESDFLKAAILHHYPGIGDGFGNSKEIWEREGLAAKWGFPAELHATVGTGLSDEAAAALPIPPKEELLSYLRASYEAIEQFIEKFDSRYPDFREVDETLQKKVASIRMNLMVFLTHDCRHLGMMECLKGLQTGFGSATEKREK
ncbi:MAG: hypothetical protein AB1649_03215 [Chloroflexota bacterium]